MERSRMFPPLTSRISDALDILFRCEDRSEAERLLLTRCGSTLPLLRDNSSGVERVRLAVIKLSQGDICRLDSAITGASEDWRDTLRSAGFSHVEAHLKWQPLPPPILIESTGGLSVGTLQRIGMYEPAWLHERAEFQLPLHQLTLVGCPRITHRYFTGRFLLSDSGELLALEEYDRDGSPASLNRVDVRLVMIRPSLRREALVDSQRCGSIIPRQINSDGVLYDKRGLKEEGEIFHCDRDLKSLVWTELFTAMVT